MGGYFCCYNYCNDNNNTTTYILDSNMYLNISKEFLKYTCQFPEKYLDEEGDCLGGWRENDKNGPPGYLKIIFHRKVGLELVWK